MTANTSIGNRLDGIEAGGTSVVTGNVVQDSGRTGIDAGNSVVSGNTVLFSGLYGLHMHGTSVVIGNVIKLNRSDSPLAHCGYSQNVFVQNGSIGGELTGRINAGQNVCGLDTSCP